MDFYELAGRAITAMVARMHRQDQNNWAAKVPTGAGVNGWGDTDAQWATELRMVQREFHALIAPRTIWIPDVAAANLGGQPLDITQSYLALKAAHEN